MQSTASDAIEIDNTMPQSRRFVPLLAATYYILVASSLTVFNKLIFSRFQHSHAPLLLLGQSLTAVSILLLLHVTRRITLPNVLLWTRNSFTTYAPLFISNLCMLLTSLLALQLTSLLMYNTLRRTSMIFVVATHSLLHGTRPTLYTLAATFLVTCGGLIAGNTDLAFDPIGYTLAITANLSTAIYLVLLGPVRDKLRLTNLQLIFVNALANIPVLTLICVFMPPPLAVWQQFSSPAYCLLFTCSCSLAVVINHAIFVNTTTNDAIAQTVSAQVKDVLLLVTSIVFVDDPSARASGNLSGVLVGFSGSALYGIGKLVASQRKEKEPNAKLSDESEQTDSETAGLKSAEVKSNTAN